MAVFPMDRNDISPSTSVMLQKSLIFLLWKISLFSQNLMETIIGFLCRTQFSSVHCCLNLPYSATLYIQELYVTANIQMPSNSYSGERQIGNTVNYFSLTFSSQDRLLVVKGKHYVLMMILRK